MSDHLSSEQRVALKYREANDCSLVMLPNMPFWNRKAKTPEEKAEIKDRAQTLQTGIRMSYDEKVAHAELVIRKALDIDTSGQPMDPAGVTSSVKWALSYSGGKDSTVLSHLMVFGMGLKLPHVMSNTRMEYPETMKQVTKWYAMLREWGVECHTAYPDAKPKDLWKKIGVPLWGKEVAYKFRKFLKSPKSVMNAAVPDHLKADFQKIKDAGMSVTDQCCDELKKKPMKKWAKVHGVTGQFTGVRCSESRMRRMTWMRMGALYESTYHGRLWIANPLAFWTRDDVERYLDDNDIRPIRIPTVRGGSGCVTCMFGCHIAAKEGRPNALQELAVLNPKMHAAALDDWGYRPVLDLLGIPYLPQDSQIFPLLPHQRYNNTDTVMSLETELAANTAALKENTAALLAVLAASPAGVPANVTPIKPAAAPASEDIEIPAKIERKAPGRPKAAAAPADDDTPSVPAVTEPGAPPAGEHVDVDEVVAEIGEIVKQKIIAAAETGEDDEVKAAWGKIREGFGVARIGELKNRPADLLKALKAAKAL